VHWDNLLFSPIGVFIQWPLLGFVPAILFTALYHASKRRLAAWAAALWLAYSLYEYAVHRRLLCSGECDIRVDLLLIVPLLWAVSLSAALPALAALLRRRRAPGS
jgi:hypothetical protein